ncbi:hypothetical protein CMI38_02705 [Candidatus Pacearchaeota archaeon]|nr:hypothetical protein [Candidatus Pacearchaeota archaeon]|tara:strand:+ start:8240 stop:8521 length:282 start_codon:yes stop_codon:yes gene_type:complete
MVNGTQGRYTTVQMQRFQELHQQLLDAESYLEDVEKPSYLTDDSLNGARYRSLARILFGVYVPTYEKEVPEDVREEFNFDVESLVERVKSKIG